MKVRFHKKKLYQKKVVGHIRQTQLITTFGCGAVVNLPEGSFIIAGTDFWQHHGEERFMLFEPNLQSALRVDYFVKPKAEPESIDQIRPKPRDIPAFRFPKMLRCSNCRKVTHYSRCRIGKKPRCPACGSDKLIPSRFVVACQNGHLDDFPYAWWVHYGRPERCTGDPEASLYIEIDSQTGGLESIVIRCKNCGSRRNMGSSFSPKALSGYGCRGAQPWLGDTEDSCEETVHTVQRGGSSLYFPVISSSLSIPPWSDRIQRELDKHWRTINQINRVDSKLVDTIIATLGIHKSCGCSVADVRKQILLRNDRLTRSRPKTETEIVLDEYRAFLQGNSDDCDFVIQEEEVPGVLQPFIERVILAHRLREVMALRGFRRLTPDGPGIAPLSIKRQNWLPAIELNGEGVFLKINEVALKKWEKRRCVVERIRSVKSNMDRSSYRIPNLSPRYILLHTLAHLLIRQLVLQCGYSSSAIKEKIYISSGEPGYVPEEMCGILIYTATPDSEGSLGGLVREGRKDRLENTFRNMLEAASWCSSDPLCIQSQGQGMDSLNLAACHACTLLPETSCEARNCYLDRATVVGTLNNRDLGFFGGLLAGDMPNG